jgi:sialic acid synthase SpsE
MTYIEFEPVRDIKVTATRSIGDEQPTFIIAEIGQNHNGSLDIAKQLIDAAQMCGVDAVKSCKRDLKSELTRAAWDRPYEGPQSFGATYGEHRTVLELSAAQHQELHDYCTSKGMIYFVSACDTPSVDVMEEIGIPLYKVASRDLTNIPLLIRMAKTGKPIILSVGMADRDDIDDAIATVRAIHDKVVITHCTSEYPTPYEDVNLRAMHALRNQYNTLVGLSDHTIGIMTAIVAVGMGARVIEKHLTLARYMKGTDHAASLEPDGMKRVVRDIRNLEIALGDGKIHPPAGVAAARVKLARSLTSACDIPSGTTLTEEMLTLKSPGSGLKWRDRYCLLGKCAIRDIAADETLSVEDFK